MQPDVVLRDKTNLKPLKLHLTIPLTMIRSVGLDTLPQVHLVCIARGAPAHFWRCIRLRHPCQ